MTNRLSCDLSRDLSHHLLPHHIFSLISPSHRTILVSQFEALEAAATIKDQSAIMELVNAKDFKEAIRLCTQHLLYFQGNKTLLDVRDSAAAKASTI